MDCLAILSTFPLAHISIFINFTLATLKLLMPLPLLPWLLVVDDVV
jgi:hypothetical protein